MADIRDPHAFVTGRWAWHRFGYDSAFTGRISIGDIDGMVERNGHHLFIENKHAHSGAPLDLSLPTGQRIALESLCRSGHTVLVLHGCGHNNDPVYLQTWKPDGNGGIDRNGMDLQEMDLETRRYCLREFFANWCQWAEGKNERTETQTRMEAPF